MTTELIDPLHAVLHVASQLGAQLPSTLRSWAGTAAHSMGVYDDWISNIEGLTSLAPLEKWVAKYYDSPEKRAMLSDQIEMHLHVCATSGASYITAPALYQFFPSLGEMPVPPLALTVLGNYKKSSEATRTVAIVGSRRASCFSLSHSFDLGRVLADRSVSVVSGGAYGCDIAAHRGCLSSRVSEISATVVFAGGLGCLYPQSNVATFKNLVERGGILVSERLWYQQPRPYHFPIRNRLIAGMAKSIALMQASKKSGAMSTCRHAVDQGKSVFVLAPPPQDRTMDGNLELIFQGAPSFYSPTEFLRYL